MIPGCSDQKSEKQTSLCNSFMKISKEDRRQREMEKVPERGQLSFMKKHTEEEELSESNMAGNA